MVLDGKVNGWLQENLTEKNLKSKVYSVLVMRQIAWVQTQESLLMSLNNEMREYLGWQEQEYDVCCISPDPHWLSPEVGVCYQRSMVMRVVCQPATPHPAVSLKVVLNGSHGASSHILQQIAGLWAEYLTWYSIHLTLYTTSLQI